jgi:hypothetical protein
MQRGDGSRYVGKRPCIGLCMVIGRVLINVLCITVYLIQLRSAGRTNFPLCSSRSALLAFMSRVSLVYFGEDRTRNELAVRYSHCFPPLFEIRFEEGTIRSHHCQIPKRIHVIWRRKRVYVPMIVWGSCPKAQIDRVSGTRNWAKDHSELKYLGKIPVTPGFAGTGAAVCVRAIRTPHKGKRRFRIGIPSFTIFG